MNLTEEQQRQCREAFDSILAEMVKDGSVLEPDGWDNEEGELARAMFAAGLVAARGEAVVLNVSAWGNDDKTYVSTTKKHPSGDIEVTTSEASQPPQPAISLDTAPIGTKAPAVGGGNWHKTERGWQWGVNGSTFPRPGGDWTGELIEPPQPASEPVSEDRIADAKEKLAELFFQCARYERPSMDWFAALDAYTKLIQAEGSQP